MKKVLVPIAPGFEEIEALAVVDILRRAGVTVVMAGTVEGPIEGRNGIRVLTDEPLDEAAGTDGAGYDMIVLPGGAQGTENLKKDERIRALVEAFVEKNAFVTAICAAPTVLSAIGVTAGRTVTSHPGVRDTLVSENVLDDRVVVDGNIITSQGPGTAIEFAFALVEALFGPEKAAEVNKGVLAHI